jgi:hypothetical protein
LKYINNVIINDYSSLADVVMRMVEDINEAKSEKEDPSILGIINKLGSIVAEDGKEFEVKLVIDRTNDMGYELSKEELFPLVEQE